MSASALMEMLSASDIRLSVTGERLKVDAPVDVLTEQHRALLRQHKAELLRLLTPKPCAQCGAPMEHVEAGYFSCPACHSQVVEARSGFFYRGAQ